MTNFEKTPGIDLVRVRVLPDGRMDRKKAATYLGMSEKTLAMWAWETKGPQSKRVGGRIFYYKEDLDAFIRGEEQEKLNAKTNN